MNEWQEWQLVPPRPHPCACPVPWALWEEGGAVAGFPLYQKGREEGSQLCARVVPASGTVCSGFPGGGEPLCFESWHAFTTLQVWVLLNQGWPPEWAPISISVYPGVAPYSAAH